MAAAQPPSLNPDQLVAVAINAIATQASFAGLAHDSRRLADTLERCDMPELAMEVLTATLGLGRVLERVTRLGIPVGATLEQMAAHLEAREMADDTGGGDDG